MKNIKVWPLEAGGHSSAVRDQLKGVEQIQATNSAFAAILQDGSVVAWGDQYWGGDSSAVQDQLKGVQKIQATDTAFAAILEAVSDSLNSSAFGHSGIWENFEFWIRRNPKRERIELTYASSWELNYLAVN